MPARSRSGSTTLAAASARSRIAARTTTGLSARETSTPRRGTRSARGMARESRSARGDRCRSRPWSRSRPFPSTWRTGWSRSPSPETGRGVRHVETSEGRLDAKARARLAPRRTLPDRLRRVRERRRRRRLNREDQHEQRRRVLGPTRAIVGAVADRCWESFDPLYNAYHDEEWGLPVLDERGLYERLCLEGFQSGLSWLTILRKREAFRS